MKRNIQLVFVAVAMLFSQIVMANNNQEAVPGEYLVKLKNNVGLMMLNSLSTEQSPEVVSKKSNLYLIKRNVLESREFVINEFSKDDNIAYIEPNYIYRRMKAPNDPELTQLWGLKNAGQKDSSGTTGKIGVDVDALKAWDIHTGTGKTVVAVIDTGVDYTIEDLAPNMWTNRAELNGEEGVDDDGNGYVDDIYGYDFVNNDGDPIDDHGHGSHVAGTIAASGNNGKGVVGVAWKAKIMGLKFLSASGSGTLANAVKAIDYATDMGARLSNNSWGGGGFSESLKEAIERANAKNILFVAAAGNHAGNNDTNPSYPASYPIDNVVSVAAINNKGELARFSCYGATSVHVGAPGVNILSTTPDGLRSWSGTSMASPHVAGVATLLFSKFPKLTAKQVKDRMIRTSEPLSDLRQKVVSKGVVNAFYALKNQEAPRDPEDPHYWKRKAMKIETAHPYESSTAKTWKIEVPGAKKIAVHFKRFETEKRYDKVEFINEQKGVHGHISGNANGIYSETFDGSSITMKFTSDNSVEKWGFEVDYISYKK